MGYHMLYDIMLNNKNEELTEEAVVALGLAWYHSAAGE